MIHFYVDPVGKMVVDREQTGQTETKVNGFINPWGLSAVLPFIYIWHSYERYCAWGGNSRNSPTELTSCLKAKAGQIGKKKYFQQNRWLRGLGRFRSAHSTVRQWPGALWSGGPPVANPRAASPATHSHFTWRTMFTCETWERGLIGLLRVFITPLPNLHVGKPHHASY